MNDLEKVLEIIRVSDPSIYTMLSDNFEFIKTYRYSIILKFKSESHKVIALLGLEQYYCKANLLNTTGYYDIPLNFKHIWLQLYLNKDTTISAYGFHMFNNSDLKEIICD